MKIELSVHAVRLKNVAGAFKGTSDPFVVATQIATSPGSHAKVLGKAFEEACINARSFTISTLTCCFVQEKVKL